MRPSPRRGDGAEHVDREPALRNREVKAPGGRIGEVRRGSCEARMSGTGGRGRAAEDVERERLVVGPDEAQGVSPGGCDRRIIKRRRVDPASGRVDRVGGVAGLGGLEIEPVGEDRPVADEGPEDEVAEQPAAKRDERQLHRGDVVCRRVDPHHLDDVVGPYVRGYESKGQSQGNGCLCARPACLHLL